MVQSPWQLSWLDISGTGGVRDIYACCRLDVFYVAEAYSDMRVVLRVDVPTTVQMDIHITDYPNRRGSFPIPIDSFNGDVEFSLTGPNLSIVHPANRDLIDVNEPYPPPFIISETRVFSSGDYVLDVRASNSFPRLDDLQIGLEGAYDIQLTVVIAEPHAIGLVLWMMVLQTSVVARRYALLHFGNTPRSNGAVI